MVDASFSGIKFVVQFFQLRESFTSGFAKFDVGQQLECNTLEDELDLHLLDQRLSRAERFSKVVV